jgi:hypothetical protein
MGGSLPASSSSTPRKSDSISWAGIAGRALSNLTTFGRDRNLSKIFQKKRHVSVEERGFFSLAEEKNEGPGGQKKALTFSRLEIDTREGKPSTTTLAGEFFLDQHP